MNWYEKAQQEYKEDMELFNKEWTIKCDKTNDELAETIAASPHTSHNHNTMAI